jgi:hypothetical protein
MKPFRAKTGAAYRGARHLIFGLTVAVLALPSAGCRERRHWTKPQAEQSRSDLDHAACHALAQKRARREYEIERQINEATGTGGGGLPRTLAKLDAEKREKELFEACLSRRGYQPVPVK